jgi:hypothetical protein
VISQYQYERLSYYIDNYKLTYEELAMIDDFLADPNMDSRLPWLINTLQKRSHR